MAKEQSEHSIGQVGNEEDYLQYLKYMRLNPYGSAAFYGDAAIVTLRTPPWKGALPLGDEKVFVMRLTRVNCRPVIKFLDNGGTGLPRPCLLDRQPGACYRKKIGEQFLIIYRGDDN
jgi:hypothetical protein